MDTPNVNVTTAAVENNQIIRANSLGASATTDAQAMPLVSGSNEVQHQSSANDSEELGEDSDEESDEEESDEEESDEEESDEEESDEEESDEEESDEDESDEVCDIFRC
jgi:hypothetical protein